MHRMHSKRIGVEKRKEKNHGKKNNTSAYKHKKTPLITDMKRHKWLYLMVLPGVIWMIIFCYLPMGGLVMAFQNYKLRIRGHSGIFSSFIYSEFVGLDNFKEFFTSKPVSVKYA